MHDLRFESLNMAWVFLALPIALIGAYLSVSRARSHIKKFANENNLNWILSGRSQISALAWRDCFVFLAVIFFVFALLRPQANPVEEEFQTNGLDIVIALDVSRSMDAEDVYPSRLRKAKKSIGYLLDQLSGDRVGIVAFAGSAHLVCPLTADYDVIKIFLQSVDTGLFDNQGTNVQAAVEEALRAFERGAENTGNAQLNNRIVVLMSDGEETQGKSTEAIKVAAQNGLRLHSIALGSTRGVPIPIRDANGILSGHKRDQSGNIVLTQINPDSLRGLAEAGRGLFAFSTMDESEIDAILKAHKDSAGNKASVIKTKLYTELFWIPLSLGIVCLFIAFCWGGITLGRNRRVALVILCFISTSIHAKENQSEPELPWHSIFWDSARKNFIRAQQYLSKQLPDKALDVLARDQARNPDSPTIKYNVATAMLEEGKREEAKKLLEGLATPNSEVAPYGQFNLGGIEAKSKKTDAALNHYLEAIQALERNKKTTEEQQELIKQARKNIELLARDQSQNESQRGDNQQEKPEQEKKNDPQSNKQEQGENKDSEPNIKSQADPEKDRREKSEAQPKESPKENFSRGKRDFNKREDLSAQDADRILGALKEQEAGLNKKLLKRKLLNEKKDNKETHGKDW